MEGIINRLINAVKEQNYKAVSACFEDSKDTKFIDYCPINVGVNNYFVYGSCAIEMFFRDKFYNNSYFIAEEKIESENSATFFGCYCGRYYFGRLTIEEMGKNGLIKKAVIRPE